MLNTLGMEDAANLIWEAIRSAVREKKTTADLGGSLNTREVGDYLCAHIEKSGA